MVYILIDLVNEKVFASKGIAGLSRKSGFSYATLKTYFKQDYFINKKVITCKTDKILKQDRHPTNIIH